jgi:hypothetical protein
MDQIVANVRANEHIYDNIEVIYKTTYRLENRDGRNVPVEALASRTEEFRSVGQNSFYYFARRSDESSVGGQTQRRSLVRGYDGELTRSKESDRIVNIQQGRSNEGHLFRPHNWMFMAEEVCCPLSVFLIGGTDFRQHPGGTYWRDFTVKNSLLGEEIIDGLICFKVRSQTIGRAGPSPTNSVQFIWLSIDRNYLPVKRVTRFVGAEFNQLIVSETVASDFREIAAGVWLPFHFKRTAYDPYEIRTNKRHILSSVEEANIDVAKLDPNYDISFFRDVSIPQRAYVYEVNASGKITSAYIEDYGIQEESALSVRRRWLIFAAIGIGSLLLASWWFRNRRSRATRAQKS